MLGHEHFLQRPFQVIIHCHSVTGSRYSDCHRYPKAGNTVPLLRNVGVEQIYPW
jgi:hypothetical protein